MSIQINKQLQIIQTKMTLKQDSPLIQFGELGAGGEVHVLTTSSNIGDVVRFLSDTRGKRSSIR